MILVPFAEIQSGFVGFIPVHTGRLMFIWRVTLLVNGIFLMYWISVKSSFTNLKIKEIIFAGFGLLFSMNLMHSYASLVLLY